MLAGVLSVSAVAAQAAADDGATPPAAKSASTLAVETGEPVEVMAERTEFSQVFAQPDGTFKYTEATTPQRVKDADGSWMAVDATLAKRADGRIAPQGAMVDVSFAAGGSGASLIKIGDRQGHSMTLGWPGTLSEPVLDGPTATYREVLPGVDLQLTATAESYREVLVVKTADAAANPELDKITFNLAAKELRVKAVPDGGLTALDEDGNEVFTGPPARLWDSAGDAPAARLAGEGEPEGEVVDPATGPDADDAAADMPIQVADGQLAVVPDTGVLNGADTVYPVFIDPAVGIGHTYRTVVSSKPYKHWMFEGAGYGIGRCGYNSDATCSSDPYTDRMFFQFNSAESLRGRYVLDATFRAYETWSFDCNPAWVDLERTSGGISSGTDWPGPASVDQMGDKYISAGRDINCSPSQPNQWVEFNDNPAEPDENLKKTVRNFADGTIDNLTFMLKAKDESDVTAWKRFDDNAELSVEYVYQPGTPTRYGVWAGNMGGDPDDVQCATSATAPGVVSRLDPYAQAAVQTKVEYGAGNSEGLLQAEWEIQRSSTDTASGTWTKAWGDYMPPSGWDPDGTVESQQTTTLVKGGLYRIHARTQSHWSYNGNSGDLFSSYTPWCYFKVDPDRPQAPTVTAASVYSQCTTEACVGAGGPGVKGTFQFAPNSADTDVTKYEWRLPGLSGTRTATGSTATVEVTPQLAGSQVLEVRGYDAAGYGAWRLFKFKVNAGQAEVGRWRFADGIADPDIVTAADTGTVGTRHAATLYNKPGDGGSGWSTLGRRGEADQSLFLNDVADTTQQNGYAATSAPAVNTSDSFTVSAWAYLTDTSKNQSVVAGSGSNDDAFLLYYSSTYNKWIFNRADKDTTTAKFIRSQADKESPTLRVWTHLAGVFDTKGDADPNNDTIQLFVNGQPQGQPVNAHDDAAAQGGAYEPWAAGGATQFGREKSTTGGYFHGRVDEAAVWQRPLAEAEIRLESLLLEGQAAATERMAYWDAELATGTEIANANDAGAEYQVPALKLAGSATLAGTPQQLTLNGTTSYASGTGPVVDETGSFTVSANVEVSSAKLVGKPNGYTVQVAGQKLGGESSWALSLEKVNEADIDGDGDLDQIALWRFERATVDATGKKTASTVVKAVQPAALDDAAQVTGVYNAAEEFDDGSGVRKFGKLHLFVGGDEHADSDTQPNFAGPQQGTGELAVGRGYSGGTVGRYLPGAVGSLRVWTGAMGWSEVAERVLGETPPVAG
ncbi:LamG-like jellyroll fold domain-containing protein [Streptomyces sp. NPDC056656]|uniref:LamG-like jellyroll fold domain-containing protein n=1 Tax=Streptomyces sp. NPDC056656 TaxID=3345895 RepID=UPI0036998FEE